jgi:hypothetical protein
MDEKIILNKDGLQFMKYKTNNYSLHFNLENNNIILTNIIDFTLIKLIYDLNPDIYENVMFEKINENEVIANFLMKHFFQDIGLPQRFTFFHIKKNIEESKIVFNINSIKTHRPINMPPESELLDIKKLTITCNIISPHQIVINFEIILEDHITVPLIAERMIGIIINKIFKRIKQFIENIRI